MQTRSITLIVFETLSYCNNVCKTAATADSFFLAANKEMREDLSEEETIIVPASCFYCICLFAMQDGSRQ